MKLVAYIFFILSYLSFKAQVGDDIVKNIYLKMNVNYPQQCREMGIVGRVYVKFLVNPQGQILKPFVLYSSGSKLLDNEAIRAIKNISDPIKLSNNKDLVVIMPVNFDLDNSLKFKLSQNLKSSDKLSSKALKYFNNGKYSYALEKYQTALNLNPGNIDIINKLGLTYYKLNLNDSICYYWKEMKIDFNISETDSLIKKHCTN